MSNFEIRPYKAMPGYHVVEHLPSGLTRNIDDWKSKEPASQIEAVAQQWIDQQSKAEIVFFGLV